jgi:hypothetical protein
MIFRFLASETLSEGIFGRLGCLGEMIGCVKSSFLFCFIFSLLSLIFYFYWAGFSLNKTFQTYMNGVQILLLF